MNLPRETELALDERAAQWAVRGILFVMALLAIGLGIAILLGGISRFSGISYSVALSLPGAPASWGWTILVAGLVVITGIVVGRPLITGAGMALGAFWCFLFAGAFAVAAVRYANANLTAMQAYTAAGLVCAIISGAHITTWRVRRQRQRLRKV